VLSDLHQLTWLNLPMSQPLQALLPLLTRLPALEQLYLQVVGEGGGGWSTNAASVML
jgi:hypothetical protein